MEFEPLVRSPGVLGSSPVSDAIVRLFAHSCRDEDAHSLPADLSRRLVPHGIDLVVQVNKREPYL